MTSESMRHSVRLAQSLTSIDSIATGNKEMRECLDIAAIAAGSDAPVLLVGESGTGKSLLAQAIHHTSARRNHPCIVVNCPTADGGSAAAELFGAGNGDAGVFAAAENGAVILDGADMLPDAVRKAFIDAILERRAADGDKMPRLISTASRRRYSGDGVEPIAEDVIYCLAEIVIRIPPLRKRAEDLPLLTQSAILAANKAHGKEVRGLSLSAMDFLRHYSFPGNVRELFAIIDRTVAKTRRDILYVEDLGLEIDAVDEDPHLFSNLALLPLSEMERRHINKALLRTGWKKKAAAGMLRITLAQLERKIVVYGLEKGGED